MMMFRVKNFERFQHYKDRAPPWIKLYNELLDDYEFGALPDATKMHLIAIWLLASRSENKIPYDPQWVARRINANSKVDLDVLRERGFILVDQALRTKEQDASTPQAECLSRERGEGEDIEQQRKNIRSASPPGEDFESLKKNYPRRAGNYGWKAAERKFNSLIKTGVDPKVIIASAARLGETLRAKIGTEFIPMPASWMNSEDFAEHAADNFLAQQAAGAHSSKYYAKAGSEQLDAWDAHNRATKGQSLPRDKLQGWLVDTEWPPGYVPPERSQEAPPIPSLRSMQ